MRRRATEVNKRLVTRVVKEAGSRARVRFWAMDETDLAGEPKNTAVSFLIGELIINEAVAGIPRDVMFFNNTYVPGPDGILQPQPHTTFGYKGVIGTAPLVPGYFARSAYQNVPVSVNDFRFEGSRAGYKLEANSEPPFPGTAGYLEQERANTSRRSLAESNLSRRRVTVVVLLTLPFAIWSMYRGLRRKPTKYKTAVI